MRKPIVADLSTRTEVATNITELTLKTGYSFESHEVNHAEGD